MSGPLSGLRVVELASFITAPYAGMLLALMGADVVKLEPPDGDPFRRWEGGGESPQFIAVNSGKRSAVVDVRSDAGSQQVVSMLAHADVFITNLRPVALTRSGLDYATVAERAPGLVYCAVTGGGSSGAHANRPMYDAIGQALSGLMSLLNEPTDPHPRGPALSDSLTGLYATIAILGALHDRQRTGRGCRVETSMLQATLGFLGDPAARYQLTEEIATAFTRPHRSQSFGFVCSDGRRLVVHLSTPDKFWSALCGAVRREDLLRDPAYADYAARVVNYARLQAELATTFATRTADFWIAALQKGDVPVAPVNTVADALADPSITASGAMVATTLPNGQVLTMPSRPFTVPGMPDRLTCPALGYDTKGVLLDYGIYPAESTVEEPQGAAP